MRIRKYFAAGCTLILILSALVQVVMAKPGQPQPVKYNPPRATATSPADDRNRELRELAELLATSEKIRRLPKENQRTELVEIYQRIRPKLRNSCWSALDDYVKAAPVLARRSGLSPQQFADELLKAGALNSLANQASNNCDTLLKEHADLLKDFVLKDLESSNTSNQNRGLQVISDLGIPKCIPQVIKLLGRPETEMEAAYALRGINDPSSIDYLIACDPGDKLKYFEIIRSLQARRPASQTLVKLLSSKESGLRWKAAYTLCESGDESLLPKILPLLSDADPTVRRNAAKIPFNFSAPGLSTAKPCLLKLLRDPDKTIRVEVAESFASIKDMACAFTLLGLAKDPTIDQAWTGRVFGAINILTLADFKFDYGQKVTSALNVAAASRFEAWIRKNMGRSAT